MTYIAKFIDRTQKNDAMFHNDIRTQNINYTVQRMTKSTNTNNHLTSRRDKQETKRNEQDREIPSSGSFAATPC